MVRWSEVHVPHRRHDVGVPHQLLNGLVHQSSLEAFDVALVHLIERPLPDRPAGESVTGAPASAGGLTAWAAFQKQVKKTMVMGDIVLLEDQVNPVMSAALDNGLEVTALHNHFFWDSPKVMFMHVGGMGEEQRAGVSHAEPGEIAAASASFFRSNTVASKPLRCSLYRRTSRVDVMRTQVQPVSLQTRASLLPGSARL
jgi:hypothetical protein